VDLSFSPPFISQSNFSVVVPKRNPRDAPRVRRGAIPFVDDYRTSGVTVGAP